MQKRKLDNIEKDSAAALRLGYGVHYGHYKADHPHTKEREEPAPPEPMGVCRQCGKLFPYRYGKFYCDDVCRYAYNQGGKAGRREYQVETVGDYTACVECGKLFLPVRKGNVFCSVACCSRKQARERYREKHGYYERGTTNEG